MKVKHSLFSRILKLFIYMSLATLVLTALVYLPVSRFYIQELKTQEMEPVFDSMEDIMASYTQGVINQQAMERIIYSQIIANNAQLIISNDRGQVIFATKGIQDDRSEGHAPNEVDVSQSGILSGILYEVLETQVASTQTTTLDNSNFESIIIGRPLKNDGLTYGAMLLVIPVFEISRSVNGLILALILSMALVMGLMSIVIYFFTKRLSAPLHQMMQVANEMSHGNFDLKADEKDQSEIGALGSSLNQMSTSLKDTLDAIELERTRLSLMLESMQEGVISIDHQQNILLMNPAFKSLFETEDASIILNHPSVKNCFDRGLKGEVKSILFDDHQRHIGLSVSPITTQSNEISGCVGIFTDRSEAEKLEKMRRDYVANVSHELRTPLTAIRALLDPLNDQLIKDEAKKAEYYRLMLKETERLNRLINDLLELSRLQSSNESFILKSFDLNQLIQEMVDKFDALASQKGIQIKMDGLDEVTHITSNEDRLEQVLTILLDNAFKFTLDHGTISLILKTSHTGELSLSVKDTGTGIASSDLPYIFDRFYTADKARTQKSFGLGLSIAKEITDRLNIKLQVNSKLNEGSTFILTFPQA